MPKVAPAILQLQYLLAHGTTYIDLAKDLSAINRRLYRQGMVYAIQDVQIRPVTGQGPQDITDVELSTMGNSWVVHNSWVKAYSAWREQQKLIKDAVGPSIEGKWADFKIYLDDTHEDGTTANSIVQDGGQVAQGEWEHSKFVFDDDGTEREFKAHMIGSTNLSDTNEESAIGLIHQYNLSRARVQTEPAVSGSASDSIYAKLFATDEMSDMMVDNLEDDNDNPPYDNDEYPGGHTNADAGVIQRYVSVTAMQGANTVPGFIAPCGLIKAVVQERALDGSSEYAIVTSPGVHVILTLVAGTYKGVMASTMGQ